MSEPKQAPAAWLAQLRMAVDLGVIDSEPLRMLLDDRDWHAQVGAEHRLNLDRFAVARAAMDALTGPERVELIRHYMGSAKKALRSLGAREREAPPKRYPIGADGLCTICRREVCEHTTDREMAGS